jgi:hypothetical protein
MDSPKPEPGPIWRGSKKPWYKLKNESPLHIAAAHLAAAGANHRKIYRELGKSESWMTNLARQPFFQARVDAILRNKIGAGPFRFRNREHDIRKKLNYLRAAERRPRDPLGRFCG